MTSPSPMADAPKPLTAIEEMQAGRMSDERLIEVLAMSNVVGMFVQLPATDVYRLAREVTASRAARGVDIDAASLALARADITYRGGKFTYTDDELRGTFAYEEAKRRVEVVFSAAPAPAEADALRAALDKLWDELSDQHEVDDPDDRCSICQAIQGVKRALTASTAAAGEKDNG